ncbi:hypothetical protein [Streptomyces atratus]|uniref:hypothetical protein n=1 Tax=Streptomyces atratus TaxID=1893 RepID=UPI00224CE434|nr:hypothetical protein [Streptomyces atratus]MCX5338700.1 hypothetical protein [Streptomyces atratus]
MSTAHLVRFGTWWNDHSETTTGGRAHDDIHTDRGLEAALGAALAPAELSGVLAAAWDAFDLVERVADAVTWDGGGDELGALIAAQACSAGRRLPPLPEQPGPRPGPARRRDPQVLPPPPTPAPIVRGCFGGPHVHCALEENHLSF